jgi:hypothetical protein
VHFYASTDTAATSWGTWNGDAFHEGSKQQEGGVWLGSGGGLTFAAGEKPVVQCKVGISFVSEAQAKGNVAGSTYTGVHPGLPPLQQACFLTCFSGPGQERPMSEQLIDCRCFNRRSLPTARPRPQAAQNSRESLLTGGRILKITRWLTSWTTLMSVFCSLEQLLH